MVAKSDQISLSLKDSSMWDGVAFMPAVLYLNLPICHFLCTVVSIVTMPTATPMM